MSRRSVGVPIVLAVALAAAPAHAAGEAKIAALQVALRAHGLYESAIDGVAGPKTRRAVVRFQRRAGLAADGVVGPRTRRALGRLGRPGIGARVLRRGRVGWDVAALQFALAWHGYPSGVFDGVFGPRTDDAVRRFQQFAGLRVDGVVGNATLAALRGAPPASPLSLSWPVNAPVTSPFGPRGARFHAGIDLAAGLGTPVVAARGGVVTFADWNDGFGKLVVVAHGAGVVTLYAHLSEISVAPGSRLAGADVLGRVGSTGRSTGPHLHFEVRVRGAAVDPLTALP
jgi:murein DD-endopeptidase MepM/ murein hydrolase activator NlpD